MRELMELVSVVDTRKDAIELMDMAYHSKMSNSLYKQLVSRIKDKFPRIFTSKEYLIQ